MVYVFLAKGFEELEVLAPVDVLRRAGVLVKTVGVTGKRVSGSHGISINCDITIDEAVFDELEGIILPGGLPGTTNLEADETVNKFIDFAAENGWEYCCLDAGWPTFGDRLKEICDYAKKRVSE